MMANLLDGKKKWINKGTDELILKYTIQLE